VPLLAPPWKSPKTKEANHDESNLTHLVHGKSIYQYSVRSKSAQAKVLEKPMNFEYSEPAMSSGESKARQVRRLLRDRECSAVEVAQIVGCSERWVRACQSRLHGRPSRIAVLDAGIGTLQFEVSTLKEQIEVLRSLVEALAAQVSSAAVAKY
jgi:hypothetical protein